MYNTAGCADATLREGGKNMRLCSVLLAVTDMERSLRFYHELFGLNVIADFGWCKTLDHGVTLQLNFDRIAGFDKETMAFHANSSELYFETDDLDGFLRTIEEYGDVEKMHDMRTFPWLQRGIRIYDPDGHLIEVSDSMESVGHRLFSQGASIEETAEKTQHPIDLVRQWHKSFIEGKL